jgi:hypothetical protein
MVPTTPYSKHLGNREALKSMRETNDRIRAITDGWTPQQFERTYAPGKWTVRQILTHLAQTELALGYRARIALGEPGCKVQPFDQDVWMKFENGMSGTDAAAARYALRVMNLALFQGLSAVQRQTVFTHPEYGALTVDWVIHMLAGHDWNHLKQLEEIKK